MASRTRERLIETARQLFIHKGVENTTIGDIADACDKGRRTIYTYFKNKVEIYNAVIEQESDRMVAQLKDIVDSNITPKEKLRNFIVTRIAPDMNTTSPSPILRSLLCMDFGRTDKVRRKASEKVLSMLNTIIDEGIYLGVFDSQQAHRVKATAVDLIRSIDTLSASDEHPLKENFGADMADFIVNGIMAHK